MKKRFLFVVAVLVLSLSSNVCASDKKEAIQENYSSLKPAFGWYSTPLRKVPKIHSYQISEFRGKIVAVEVTPIRKLKQQEIQKKKFRGFPETVYETRDGIFLVDVNGEVKLGSRYFVLGHVSPAIKKNDYKVALHVYQCYMKSAIGR